MKERYFRIGSLHGIRPSHIHAPRVSGLPHGYFDKPNWGDRLIVALCIVIAISLLFGWTT